MRAVFKILLAPIWLLLTILKLAFRLAAGPERAQRAAFCVLAELKSRRGYGKLTTINSGLGGRL